MIWTLDSGSTSHYVISSELLHNIRELEPAQAVKTADGTIRNVTLTGTAYIIGDEPDTIWELPNVKVVPHFTHNLLSVSQLTNNPYISITYTKNNAYITDHNNIIITAQKQNNLYAISLYIPHNHNDHSDDAAFNTEDQHHHYNLRDRSSLQASSSNNNNNTSTSKTKHNKHILDKNKCNIINTPLDLDLPNNKTNCNISENHVTNNNNINTPQQIATNDNQMIDHNNINNSNNHNIITPPPTPNNNNNNIHNDSCNIENCNNNSNNSNSKMNLIHDLFGHLSWYSLEHIARAKAVTGLPADHNNILKYTSKLSGSHMLSPDTVCDTCATTKAHRLSFSTKSKKPAATYQLFRISADLCGPINVEGQEQMKDLIGTQQYLSLIVDEYSRYMNGRILSGKDGATLHLLDWISHAERQTQRKLVYFLSDDGGEYQDSRLREYFRSHGVTVETTSINTPQHNSRVERANRTVFAMVRALLHRSKLGTVFWGYAALFAINILNHRIIPTHNTEKTPHELWTDLKPDVSHFHVFGCDAFVHLTQEPKAKGKLKDRAVKCIFLGYSKDKERSYIFYNPENRSIFVRRDVVFYDNQFTVARTEVGGSADSNSDLLRYEADADIKVNELLLQERKEEAPNAGANRTSTRANKGIPPSTYGRHDFRDFTPESLNQLRGDLVGHAMIADCNSLPDPTTYEEAINAPDAAQWKAAMKEEMDALHSHGTWTLESVPHGSHIIGCKWVFKKKLNADGSVERYKARLCAKGFSQIEGVDYHETFAPVMKYKSQRLLLVLATIFNYEADQMDVVTAFLNGEMKELVYMRQPEGFTDGDPKTRVCRLVKTLYGTKQAPREWNAALNDFLVNTLKMKRCIYDSCIYVKQLDTTHLIAIGVFVDDMLIVYPPHLSHEWMKMKDQMMNRFKIKDLGPVKWMLGMNIERDRENKTLKIDSERYIEMMLKKYNMSDCNPLATPEEKTKLSKAQCPQTEKEKNEMISVPFRNAVGSIAYSSLSTRPDVTHAVNEVSSFLVDPGNAHWVAVKRILRYLRGAFKKPLVFRAGDNANVIGVPTIEAYADADWGGNIDDSRSTTGFVIRVNGNTIHWGTKRQSCVATSTAEAEYIALSDVAKEVLWLKQLLAEMFNQEVDKLPLPVIYSDNQAAKFISENDAFHQKSKHIRIRYHFVRECVANKEFKIEWISTQDQLADILTKATDKNIFTTLSNKIMNG